VAFGLELADGVELCGGEQVGLDVVDACGAGDGSGGVGGVAGEQERVDVEGF
jgi:hypothetical protein